MPHTGVLPSVASWEMKLGSSVGLGGFLSLHPQHAKYQLNLIFGLKRSSEIGIYPWRIT